LLLQALYQLQLTGHSKDALLNQFVADPGFDGSDQEYFRRLLDRILDSTAELDGDIDVSGEISSAKLDPIEHAVLWIAIAEMRFQPDVPVKVVINEAIELAKEFGAEGGYRFVNGVLDKLAGKLRASGT